MALFKSNSIQKVAILKKVIEPKRILNLLLIIFSLGWIATLFFFKLGIKQNYLFSILAIMGLNLLLNFFFSSKLIKNLKIEKNYVLAALCLLRVFLEYKSLFSIDFIIGFLILTFIYLFIRIFIEELGVVFSKKVAIKNLKEGMILAKGVTEKDKKNNMAGVRSSPIKQTGFLFEFGPERLSKKRIRQIKLMKKQGKIKENELEIESALPFATFLFLGALLTVILKNNIFSFVLMLVS